MHSCAHPCADLPPTHCLPLQNWDGDVVGPAIYQFQQIEEKRPLFWETLVSASPRAPPEMHVQAC